VKPTYLRVRNWEKLQNADIFKKSHGCPPWIKFKVDFLDDYEIGLLSYATQLVYLKLLLVAAKTSNAIPNDIEWLAKQTGMDAGTILEGVTVLLEGAWLSQTKSPRRSRKIRESLAQKSPLDKTRQEKIRQEEGLYADEELGRIIDLSLKGIA
jgi:hypothetical protein